MWNDKDVFNLGMRTAEKMFGPDSTLVIPHSHMTGEDFSFIGDVVPSAMFWIGHRSHGDAVFERTGVNLHNALLYVDERAMVSRAPVPRVPHAQSFLLSMFESFSPQLNLNPFTRALTQRTDTV